MTQRDRIIKYVKEKLKVDLSHDVIYIDSGDNAIIMKGEFSGHSIYWLKMFAAKELGKRVEIIDDKNNYKNPL